MLSFGAYLLGGSLGGCSRAARMPAKALVRRAGGEGLLGLDFFPPTHRLGFMHPLLGKRGWFGFASGRRMVRGGMWAGDAAWGQLWAPAAVLAVRPL